jgi:hypothetical protein
MKGDEQPENASTQMQSEAAPQQTSAESTSVTPPPAKPDTTQQ